MGWLIPANTTILTSYLTTESLNNFVGASIYVFPYQIEQNTTMSFGLYINGALVSNETYDLNANSPNPASIQTLLLSNSGDEVANFSHSVLGFSVPVFLHSSIPSGANVTVAATANQPVWVQIDNNTTVHSCEANTSSQRSNAFPDSLRLAMGSCTMAPNTISIDVESDAS